jgi:hypothetical protein
MWPTLVSSRWWERGRTSSVDFCARKVRSTRHRVLLALATSSGARVVLVCSTNFPSSRASASMAARLKVTLPRCTLTKRANPSFPITALGPWASVVSSLARFFPTSGAHAAEGVT